MTQFVDVETRGLEGTDIINLEDFAPYTEDGDPNRKTHIVNPAINLGFQLKYGRVKDAQELVNTARTIGEEIMALCGHKFVPEHNPEKYDACQTCMDIASQIITEDEG